MSDHALWQPNPSQIKQSHLSQFIDTIQQRFGQQFDDYNAFHQWSVQNKNDFWGSFTEFADIKFHQPAKNIFEPGDSFIEAKWFSAAKLNFAENLLTSITDDVCITFESENGKTNELTRRALFDEVHRVADLLREQGIQAGDRVAGFMPNLPETIIAMLATASIGGIWSSCSPDFGMQGVLDRFGQIEPKILFTTDGYAYNGKGISSFDTVNALLPNLPSVKTVFVVSYMDKAVALAPNLPCQLVKFTQAPAAPTPTLDFYSCDFSDPLFIMFSSGTTGKPKCIVHGVGGTLIQQKKEMLLHVNLVPKERIFYFTTCGWMMWNWLVSALSVNGHIILFDGSPFYPEQTTLFSLIDKYQINVFGTSAKFISACEKFDLTPQKTHHLSSLRTLLSTGSPLSPESFDYVYKHIHPNIQLASISGGTDIISCFTIANPNLPVYRGELQCKGLGMDVDVFDENGKALPLGKGELVCKSPFPSMPLGFWHDDDNVRYQKAYFSRFQNIWCQGDYAEHTENGGLIIHGRSDAVLNPGGVRIGTAEIYRQVETLHEILESLAVGQEWQGDERVVLFVKLREGINLDDTLIDKIKTTIRANTTPRHVPAKVIAVPDIPKTISGKMVELAVKNLIHGLPVTNREALANPDSLRFYEQIIELEH